MKKIVLKKISLIFLCLIFYSGVHGMQPVNFSWVENEKMAGMACPAKQVHIEWLKNHNIALIVTLTDKSLEAMGLKPLDGMEFLHITVPNMGVPTKEQVDLFIERANNIISQNKAVVVHCKHGIGRTGTFLTCWLGKYLNLTSGTAAIKALRQRRQNSISTFEQEFFVHRYFLT